MANQSYLSDIILTLQDRTTQQKLVNRAVRVFLPNNELVLISNNEGKVTLDGCSQTSLRASVSSGSVQVSGYCKTDFSTNVPLAQSQEILVSLSKAATIIVKTLNQKSFEPIKDVKLNIDGMIETTDVKGEVKVEKCATEPVLFTVEPPTDFCGTPSFHFVPTNGLNAKVVLLKPLASKCMLLYTKIRLQIWSLWSELLCIVITQPLLSRS